MNQDETWHAGRPRHWPYCVRRRASSPPKNGPEPPPQFSAHVCCGQTAGWIKMALGMDVGLGPGHIVLDGEPAPLPQKGDRDPPIFGPFLQRAQCSHCKRCISYSNTVRLSVRLSVCPSVCPSHAGIVSKRRYVYIARCIVCTAG